MYYFYVPFNDYNVICFCSLVILILSDIEEDSHRVPLKRASSLLKLRLARKYCCGSSEWTLSRNDRTQRAPN